MNQIFTPRSSNGRTSSFGLENGGSIPSRGTIWPIAQLVEHLTVNQVVTRSIRVGPATFPFGNKVFKLGQICSTNSRSGNILEYFKGDRSDR